MKALFSYIILALLVLSCSGSNDPALPEIGYDYSAPIFLNGFVEGSDAVASRGDGAIEGIGVELDISLFRADETYTSAYASGPHAATVTTGDPLNTGLNYLSGVTNKSKLIGVYPAVNGTTITWNAGDRRVSYPVIDGATDIMVSGLVEGSKSDPMTTKGMNFKHLLTQVKVTIVATDEGVGKWGNVTAVEIVGKKQAIVAQLPAGTEVATTGGSIFSATGTDDLAVTSATGETITPTAPTNIKKTLGYAMFAPVTTPGTLGVKVTTVQGGTLSVDSESQLYEAGKIYELNLTFTVKGITLATVTVDDWTDGGSQGITLGN